MAIFLAVQEAPAAIRYFARIGHLVPIHASASGRALLGQYGRAERMALYRRISFQQYSPTTPISIEAVEIELRHASERGWHESFGERRLSLVVAGPGFRMRERTAVVARLMRQVLDHHLGQAG